MNPQTDIVPVCHRLRIPDGIPVRYPICSQGLSNTVLEPSLCCVPERYHPELYHLLSIEWATFGTLTWRFEFRRKPTFKAEGFRRWDFRRLLNVARQRLKVRWKKLAYLHATEFGTADECHFHFLMAREGLECAPELVAGTLREIWTGALFDQQNHRHVGGTAVIEPFDPSLHWQGASYCMKREFDRWGQPRERFQFMSLPLIKLIQNGRNQN